MLAQIIYSHQVIANQFNKSNPEPSSGITQSQRSLSKKFMIVTADKRASLAAREVLLYGGNALEVVCYGCSLFRYKAASIHERKMESIGFFSGLDRLDATNTGIIAECQNFSKFYGYSDSQGS